MKDNQIVISLATLSPVLVNFTGGLYLLLMAEKKYPNRRMLSLFMFNSFLLFTGHLFFFHEYINFYHYYDFIFFFSLLSFYPIYYLYIRQVFFTGNKHQLYLVHFSPAIIIATASFTLSAITSVKDFESYFFKMNGIGEIISNVTEKLYWLYQLARLVHIMQICIYSFFIIRHLLINSSHLKDYFSNTCEINPKRFMTVNLAFLLFMISTGLFTTVVGRGFFHNSSFIIGISGLVFSVMHLIVCLHGLQQVPVDIQIPKEFHVERISLHEETLGQIKKELLLCFEKQRPWLKSDLKIWELAVLIGTNKTYLSKVFKQEFDSNFNDFVNKYRYQEACRLMKEDNLQKQSILNISEQSGFGSETSFARTLKKFSGLRPSELRKKILNELSDSQET